MISGERNEEKITDIKNAMKTLDKKELEEFLCGSVCEDEEWFDDRTTGL